MTAHNLYVKFAPVLAELGYSPTPCDGKRPILSGWQHSPAAALDFDKYPNLNIGIVLGGEHNVACIDVDVTDQQASAEIVRLARQEWPGAPIRVGRKPKVALFIRSSEPVQKIKTALYAFPGYPDDQAVEVLASGQQVIVAGYHPDGHRYTWHDDKLTDIKADMLPCATPQDIDLFIRQANNILAGYGQPKGRVAAQSALKSVAFATSPLQGDLPDIEAAMRHISNNDRHYDDYVAMAHAIKGAVGEEGYAAWEAFSRQSAKHDDRECARIWRSIGDVRSKGAASIFYEAMQSGWSRNAVALPSAPEAPQAAEDASDYWDSGDDASEAVAPVSGDQKAKQTNSLGILRADNIQPVLDRTDMVKGILAPGQTSVLYGESNVGKTWLSLDLAIHVAMNAQWFNRHVEGGPVVYIAGEGAHGVQNRIAAFKQHHGILQGIELSVVPQSINLRDPIHDPRQEFVRLVEACHGEAEHYGKPIRLIVVDTLARAMAGGNENSSEDAGALIAVVDELRRQTGAHVMLIHHSGKDKALGMRGHSSILGAVDTVIEVTKDESGSYSVATVKKQRDMEIDAEELAYTLKPVLLGLNPLGDEVTSCVVQPDLDGNAALVAAAKAAAADEAAQRHKQPRGNNARIVWKQALNFLADNGSTLPGYISAPAAAIGCAEDDLRTYCRGKLSDPKHLATDFRKAVDALQAQEFLVRDNGYIWWLPPHD